MPGPGWELSGDDGAALDGRDQGYVSGNAEATGLA